MQYGSGCASRSVSARARMAGVLLIPAAVFVGGCTTSDGTLDPAIQSLLTTIASAVSAIVVGVAQGFVATVSGVIQPLFTAGSLALLF